MKIVTDTGFDCTLDIRLENTSKYVNEDGSINRGEVQRLLAHIEEVAKSYGVSYSLELDDVMESCFKGKDYVSIGLDDWEISAHYEFDLENADLDTVIADDIAENAYYFLRHIENEGLEGCSISAYEQHWISVWADSIDAPENIGQFNGRYTSENYEGNMETSGYYVGESGGLIPEEFGRFRNDLKHYADDLGLKLKHKMAEYER